MGRVLIVDDDLAIQNALIRILEAENHRVLSAYNGLQALKVLEQIPTPDLIILDLGMPFMKGEQFLDVRNQDPRLSKVPVIVISANADLKHVTGANEVLRKPFNLDELLVKVRRYVHSHSTAPGAFL